jgi:hypothetical protein
VNLEHAKTPKKPYEKPNLRVYGDIKTLTATVNPSRRHLDAKGGPAKTG